MFKVLLAAAGLFAVIGAHPALALELPDGDYPCTIGSYFLGDIRLENGRFSGPAFDDAYEDFYPFEVTNDGTINWGGPVGGLSSDQTTIVSTVLKNAGGGQVGFDVMLQRDNGNFQTVSCGPAS